MNGGGEAVGSADLVRLLHVEAGEGRPGLVGAVDALVLHDDGNPVEFTVSEFR